MRATRFALGSFLFVALTASASIAQQRTFVSGLGIDTNPCSRTAPCRTFTQAISQTNAGGEVIVLDSSGYGAFAISKAVSIITPPGVHAGISVFSGDGIDINVGASDTVILRGLTVNNQGSTGNGISFLTAGTLHIESCIVNGFASGTGINCSGGGKLEVKDSIARGNDTGIFITGTSAVAVDHVRLEANSSDGLAAFNGAKVTVRNSVASNNKSGFKAFSDTSADVDLCIESCVASNNSADGIDARRDLAASGFVTVTVSDSTVTNNGGSGLSAGVFFGGAALLSRGNNTVEGNAMDTFGIGNYTAR